MQAHPFLIDRLNDLFLLSDFSPTHSAFDEISSRVSTINAPSNAFSTLKEVGLLLNVSDLSNEWLENQQERLDILTHKLKFIDDALRPKVWYVADFDTKIVDPFWDEAIQLAGGISLPGLEKAYSPQLADHLLIISKLPEVAIWSHLPAWIQQHALNESEAVRQNQVTVIPPAGLWPESGWDIASTIEHLAELLYPSFFVFGNPKHEWTRFDFS